MIPLRRVTQAWHERSVTVRDLPLALFLMAPSFVPSLHSHGTQLGGLPDRSFDAPAVVAISLQSLPLAVRRRWPVGCLVLVAIGFALDQLRGYHTFAGTGLALATLSMGVHLHRGRRRTVTIFSVGYALLAVVLYPLGTESVAGFVIFYLALVLTWCMGSWLHSARAAEAEHRRRVAEETRTAERARIARELHDVVTHHVTAMIVQAEAARYLTATPEHLDKSLTAVTDAGRRATTDLRHMLDVLSPHHAAEPREPPVGRLLTLVEQTRRAGQPVEFTEEGTPGQTTRGADLVAYRVVQEGLTNALKYAHGNSTSVQVRHGEGTIAVEVSTDGAGSPTDAASGSGRGLAGLRERVDVLGGDFTAGPRVDGGFAVRARIPVEAR